MKTRTMIAFASFTVAIASGPVVAEESGQQACMQDAMSVCAAYHSRSRAGGDMPDVEPRAHLAGLPQRARSFPSAYGVRALRACARLSR